MVRTKTKRVSIGLERKTLAILDDIAASFEDFVSRGEVIDLLVSYIHHNDLEDSIFEDPDMDGGQGGGARGGDRTQWLSGTGRKGDER